MIERVVVAGVVWVFVASVAAPQAFEDVSAGYLPDGVSGIGLAVVPADISGDGTIDLYLANRGQRDRLLLRRK